MFAGDSQMLRNKRDFVISVIAINVFCCTSEELKSPPTDYETVKKYYGNLVISKNISLLHAFQMPIKLDPN